MTPRLAMLVVVAVLFTASACGEDVQLSERPELQGFPAADVADVIDRDDTSYDSTDEEVRALQQFAMGWSACRDVYEAYEELVRTGELPDEPEPRAAEVEVTGTHEAVEEFISILYRPMAEGMPEEARTQIADDLNCGRVPVEAEGDRSLDIAEALENT